MSAIEKIQNLFKTKSTTPEDSMDTVSVGLSVDPLARASLEHSATSSTYVAAPESRDDGFAHSRMASADEAVLPQNPDLLSLPLLGRRTIAQHHRLHWLRCVQG